ncbi:Methyltransferase domain-containing protein [Lentzea xinjiangensis]|uniref:Methyltransferase domain-containing protein n=1 Tax=Lentzea xinjiangensis TaxID=402600 RepID=A0A1H9V8B2_9PSEU|nr:class I SAM-dependent methyltransferase [Lentzea xinjiangensis]SES18026.1 Methyltransferase domain-containing protein [Lentzea xinjiangensis]
MTRGSAVPADYDTDPGRFEANALSTSLFSRDGDIHAGVAARIAARGCSLALDVGGGTGVLARLLLDRSVPAVVVDRAHHVARAPGPAVRADALSLPFRANAFDAAAALWVLHHVTDPAAALTEISRVLRPGGVLVVSTSSRWNDPELAWALPRWGEPTSFDAEDAPGLLDPLFEVDELTVWNAPPMTLPNRAAVALFLRGRHVPERKAVDLAEHTQVPLVLTKRGLVVWARKRHGRSRSRP